MRCWLGSAMATNEAAGEHATNVGSLALSDRAKICIAPSAGRSAPSEARRGSATERHVCESAAATATSCAAPRC
eukprot:CAMPEP_0185384514 /NCGR_PEP_ID=MMETSP1364-20130426/60051_1 /TAXON_ID=38817 /ORGANISM="Gephyrocapsa oceanica, Strain RCC1303" /LENGTH=73 /DNA_ID=CAMNT_0027986283 /DNA_START=112 /DNA_END=330 /DNA_ORIENTATION=+